LKALTYSQLTRHLSLLRRAIQLSPSQARTKTLMSRRPVFAHSSAALKRDSQRMYPGTLADGGVSVTQQPDLLPASRSESPARTTGRALRLRFPALWMALPRSLSRWIGYTVTSVLLTVN
jgi:hypothetical protein